MTIRGFFPTVAVLEAKWPWFGGGGIYSCNSNKQLLWVHQWKTGCKKKTNESHRTTTASSPQVSTFWDDNPQSTGFVCIGMLYSHEIFSLSFFVPVWKKNMNWTPDRPSPYVWQSLRLNSRLKSSPIPAVSLPTHRWWRHRYSSHRGWWRSRGRDQPADWEPEVAVAGGFIPKWQRGEEREEIGETPHRKILARAFICQPLREGGVQLWQLKKSDWLDKTELAPPHRAFMKSWSWIGGGTRHIGVHPRTKNVLITEIHRRQQFRQNLQFGRKNWGWKFENNIDIKIKQERGKLILFK